VGKSVQGIHGGAGDDVALTLLLIAALLLIALLILLLVLPLLLLSAVGGISRVSIAIFRLLLRLGSLLLLLGFLGGEQGLEVDFVVLIG
jgi:uncharacterized membrane protein